MLSAKIFATFNCGDVKHANGNTRFLRGDYSINCEDASHKAMESYAQAMVVVISIGTPVFYFALLWRSRHAKHGGGGARHLLFLSQVIATSAIQLLAEIHRSNAPQPLLDF